MIRDVFKGDFLTDEATIVARLADIKAIIFDWDGVFNNGVKQPNGSSTFSEVDSMGTNMLRFSHYLRHGEVPYTAIITGETNDDACKLGRRECFDAVYSGIKHKKDALTHLVHQRGFEPKHIAFVFDDVLDFSVAAEAGLRFMVSRECNPLLMDYARKNGLADYLTANSGNDHAVREVAELMIGMNGNYDETISNRVQYSDKYRQYLHSRNSRDPKFYKLIDETITLQ